MAAAQESSNENVLVIPACDTVLPSEETVVDTKVTDSVRSVEIPLCVSYEALYTRFIVALRSAYREAYRFNTSR